MKRLLSNLFFVVLWFRVNAQDHKQVSPEYNVHSIHQAIELDGNNLDSAWQGIEYSTPFWEFYPLDTGYSSQITQFKMAVDENNF